MKKTYGMRNTKECVLKIQKGKATIVCPFTNGNLQLKEPIPASFTTTNPVVQGVLEAHPMFQSGKIYLIATYVETAVEEPAPGVKAEPKAKSGKGKAAKAEAEAKKERVIENVKTFGDAVTALMMESDVAASDLTSVESVVRKAAELGITFPNLKA